MPRPEMSLRAAALGDKLLARLDPQTPRTIDDLLPWWERHGVLRVELVRLLRHLVEEEQVEKGPDGYLLATPGRKSPATRLEPVPAPAPPPAPPASPAPRVAPPPPPAPSGTRVAKEEPRKEEPRKESPKKEERAAKTPPRAAEPEPPVVQEAPADEAPASMAPMSVGTGTLVSRVLDELAKQPRTCAELLKVFVESNPNTVRGALARLKSSGRVLLDDQGVYHPATR